MNDEQVRKSCDYDKVQKLWTCRKCKSIIMGKKQARSIWLSDGPGPCAGTGKVKYVDVYFCPTCNEEPSFHGLPIRRTMAEDLMEDLF